ncbi:MAG: hypothetical protein K0R72_143 [Clostridia bacterium]|jgi:hypothetical protein|nr:hypothetical protein [Clostridia bacterium]
MKKNNNNDVEVKLKSNFKKYMIICIVLVIIVVGIFCSLKYLDYSKQKSIAEENAYNEFLNLDKEFEKSREVFFTVNNGYISNQITSGKYIDMVTKEPKAVSALKECDNALDKIYTILNSMLSYEDKLPVNKFNDKINEVKKVSELCHNTLYGYVVHHNNLIDTYNSWALVKINEFASIDSNTIVKTLKHYTSEICLDYIDINQDGIFEGKVEEK